MEREVLKELAINSQEINTSMWREMSNTEQIHVHW